MNDQQQSRADALTSMFAAHPELQDDRAVFSAAQVRAMLREVRAASANETGAEGLLRRAREELSLVEWEDDPPNRVIALFDDIEAYVSRSPAMAAAAPADKHSTIECQAHSGPDRTECGGTGAWSGSADERAVSFEAWCDRFPEISAVERLRDAWQEARAAASPAAERVTAALQALSADVHTLGDGWANDEAMIGLAKKYLRVEPKPASPELSLWRDFVLLAVTDTAPQPAQADAPAEAREIIEPLTEPVTIRKALLAGRTARVVLSGGDGPVAAVHLVNIGLTGWVHTKETAEAYAKGFNQAAKWMQNAMRSAPADAGEARLTDAARDTLAERRRQVEAEGWTPEHDDQYQHGAIALAAACYAANAGGVAWADPLPSFWPWMHNWWKPTTPRRDLVKAGALILAELERLDRSRP